MIPLAAGKPLTGQCILVTRAKAQASALVAKIQAQGGQVYEFPVITIADPESWAPVDAAISALDHYRWLVITSPNGAEQFTARLRAAGGDGLAALAHLRVVAVGTTTARTLERLGVKVDLMPAQFRGGALPSLMAPLLAAGDRVLMPRGDLADPAPAEQLRSLGAVVDDVVVYRTLLEGGDVAQLKVAIARGDIDYVTLTSSSTVQNLLLRLGGPEPLVGVRVAVIGPETKKAAEAAGLAVAVVAEAATMDSLVQAIMTDATNRFA
jgi:uroporphyrinogen III methyltransferase/synthase